MNESSFDIYCRQMYKLYQSEKRTEQELDDVLTEEEYKTQHRMFLRQKYKEKKAFEDDPISGIGAGTFFNRSSNDDDMALDKDKKTTVVKIKSLCGTRIWCGYEYEAWWLGMLVAIGVGLMYAMKKCFLIIFPPVSNKKNQKNGAYTRV